MFRLNIAMNGVQWPLLFKEEEKAKENWMLVTAFKPEQCVSIEDDFGQQFAAPCINISGVMLEDLDKTRQAHIELSLHHARMQSAAQAAAKADPALRQAMFSGSPAVINPVNGRGF